MRVVAEYTKTDIHKVFDSDTNTVFLDTLDIGSGNEAGKYGVFRKTFKRLLYVSTLPTSSSMRALPFLQEDSEWRICVSWYKKNRFQMTLPFGCCTSGQG